MSQLRRQAATAMGDLIQARVNLQESPTIISAPPSSVADSPRVAIWLEQFSAVWSHEDELQVDADGELMVGALASIDQGAGPALIQEGVHLSCVGTLRGRGRIWIGCRLPAKREELESEIGFAFMSEREAPGRMLVSVKDPKLGKFVLPWTWTGAAFSNFSQWTSEFAFSERLWSWINFDLDISMLVPRYDPLVTEFQLTVTTDLAQVEEDVTSFTVPFAS